MTKQLWESFTKELLPIVINVDLSVYFFHAEIYAQSKSTSFTIKIHRST